MPRPLSLAVFAVLVALPSACGQEDGAPPPRPAPEPQEQAGTPQPDPHGAAPARPPATPDFNLALERAATFETIRTLHIAQRGEVIEAEAYNDASPTSAANIKSASKSL